MKQSKELERTYFLILDKLKEPYFARLFIGMPALILLGLVASYYLGFEWKPVAAILGIYLLAKGFGIEERVIYVLSHFRFSAEQISSITYLISLPLFLLALWLAVDEYIKSSITFDVLKSLGYSLKSFIIFLMPPLFLVYLGRIYDSLRTSNNLALLRFLFYMMLTVIMIYISLMFVGWVVADVHFADLVNAIVITVLFAVILIEATHYLKRGMIRGSDLLGKEVYSSSGSYLGTIVSVNDDDKSFVYINPWKKRQVIDYGMIKEIDIRVTLM